MESLKRRADFLSVAQGRRISRPGFVLQARQTEAGESAAPGAPAKIRAPRFGFTVTKKIGNAVVRNRIRRRLREVVRQAETAAEPATDYVIVGRRAALTLQFERLVTDLRSGFAVLAGGGPSATRPN